MDHRTGVELADAFASSMSRVTARLSEFREAEFKRLAEAKGLELDALPKGAQQRAVIGLLSLGGRGDLATLTNQLKEEYGEANKSTVHQALGNLGSQFVTRQVGGVYELSKQGHLVASALIEIEHAAKALAVGAVLGSHARVERLLEEIEAWDKRLAEFLAHADSRRASPARLYDYLIGGSFNFVVDRLAAQDAAKALPWVGQAALLNRGFLNAAVARLAAEGVRQFIDVGAGLPTTLNTHDVVAQCCGGDDWRVVYVDPDPSVVELGKSLLQGCEKQVTYAKGSFESLGSMFNNPEFKILNPETQCALIAVAVLHFVPDDGVVLAALESISRALPKGSKLILSHACRDDVAMTKTDLDRADALVDAYYQRTGIQVRFRSQDQIAKLLEKHWTPAKDGQLDFAPKLLQRWRASNRFLDRLQASPESDHFINEPESSLLVTTVQTLR